MARPKVGDITQGYCPKCKRMTEFRYGIISAYGIFGPSKGWICENYWSSCRTYVNRWFLLKVPPK